jgi:FkbH-like protein
MTLDIRNLPEDLRPADYARLAREIRNAVHLEELQPIKVGFLSTYTLEFAAPFVVVEGARRGWHITPYFGRFGQFEQEIADETSGLREFEPDVVVVAMRPEDVDPDALVRYYATGGNRFASLTDELVSRLHNLVGMLRQWSQASVLVANFSAPAQLPLGVFDANVGDTLTYSTSRANGALREEISALAGAAIWDYAGLVRSCGAANWTDPRLWSLARVAVATHHQPALARHLVQTLCGVRRRPAKCLVLDLDNTLWGGVIGDDGLEGIKLGDDYPGNAYKAFQRAALSLMDRGILLAVVSKNDEEVAKQVFLEHPEMLLQWNHLAAARINWEPKSQNIRDLAVELNIGADAMVLFDDNPVERAEVQANAPEVGVVEVPTDPLRYEDALWTSGFFDQVSLSAEDRRRTEMYHAERKRQTLSKSFTSVEQFLGSLEMVAEVGEADPTTLGRITQLVNKTNQFNLTTRRHSQADLDAMARDSSHLIAWLRLHDRFGDQGLVGVAILRHEGEAGVVDTYLMSCRVMNRHVEDALLSYVAEHAKRRGCKTLIGDYLPTKKNAMVKDFYPRFGFAANGELHDGGCRYVLNLERDSVEWPAVIERREAD